MLVSSDAHYETFPGNHRPDLKLIHFTMLHFILYKSSTSTFQLALIVKIGSIYFFRLYKLNLSLEPDTNPYIHRSTGHELGTVLILRIISLSPCLYFVLIIGLALTW